jgi:hypothetical protein
VPAATRWYSPSAGEPTPLPSTTPPSVALTAALSVTQRGQPHAGLGGGQALDAGALREQQGVDEHAAFGRAQHQGLDAAAGQRDAAAVEPHVGLAAGRRDAQRQLPEATVCQSPAAP